jgi:hypothetical protein
MTLSMTKTARAAKTTRRKPKEPEMDRSEILKTFNEFNEQFSNSPWTDADRTYRKVAARIVGFPDRSGRSDTV